VRLPERRVRWRHDDGADTRRRLRRPTLSGTSTAAPQGSCATCSRGMRIGERHCPHWTMVAENRASRRRVTSWTKGAMVAWTRGKERAPFIVVHKKGQNGVTTCTWVWQSRAAPSACAHAEGKADSERCQRLARRRCGVGLVRTLLSARRWRGQLHKGGHVTGRVLQVVAKQPAYARIRRSKTGHAVLCNRRRPAVACYARLVGTHLVAELSAPGGAVAQQRRRQLWQAIAAQKHCGVSKRRARLVWRGKVSGGGLDERWRRGAGGRNRRRRAGSREGLGKNFLHGSRLQMRVGAG
jgi:hypothetical protein